MMPVANDLLTPTLPQQARRTLLHLLCGLALAGCGAGDDLPPPATSSANMPLENTLPLPPQPLPEAGPGGNAAGGTFPAGQVPAGLTDEELAVM